MRYEWLSLITQIKNRKECRNTTTNTNKPNEITSNGVVGKKRGNKWKMYLHMEPHRDSIDRKIPNVNVQFDPVWAIETLPLANPYFFVCFVHS